MSTPFDDPSRLPVRDIMCIDCKSFYASTEAIRRGEYPLASKIAVLSREEMKGGLILAASPDTKHDYGIQLGSRQFDIRPEMAIELVAPHMRDYIRLNYRINQIFRRFTDDRHWLIYSVDEAFIDVTHSHRLFGSNQEIAQKIQHQVYQATGIVTTIGIGPNPLMAKLALDNAAKESAPWLAEWHYTDVPQHVWPITPLTRFWSIGSKTAAKLERLGVQTIGDLAHTSRTRLQQRFGVLGDALYFHSWGIDYSDLARRYVPRAVNKGYGNSQILLKTYTTRKGVETVLFEIADQVAARLRRHNVCGEVISIQVGFATPDAAGQSGWSAQTHIDPTNRTADLMRAVQYLFEKKWHGEPVRSLGVRVNRISQSTTLQTSLFEAPQQAFANLRLEHTIDQIRRRYGYQAIVRGMSKTQAGTAIERSTLVGGHRG